MAHRLEDLYREGPPPLTSAAAWPDAWRKVEAAFRKLSGHGAELPGATAHTVRACGFGTRTESEVVIHTPDDEIPVLLLIPAGRPRRGRPSWPGRTARSAHEFLDQRLTPSQPQAGDRDHEP